MSSALERSSGKLTLLTDFVSLRQLHILICPRGPMRLTLTCLLIRPALQSMSLVLNSKLREVGIGRKFRVLGALMLAPVHLQTSHSFRRSLASIRSTYCLTRPMYSSWRITFRKILANRVSYCTPYTNEAQTSTARLRSIERPMKTYPAALE